jgi:hypothetical protein
VTIDCICFSEKHIKSFDIMFKFEHSLPVQVEIVQNDWYIFSGGMVILSLLAYGVYKEKQKLQEKNNADLTTTQSEYGSKTDTASGCQTKSETAEQERAKCTGGIDSDQGKGDNSALQDRTEADAARPPSARSRDSTDESDSATAKSSTGSAKGTRSAPLSESERRKKALQEWKEKLKAEMEKRQEDIEADSERNSHVVQQDPEAAKAIRMEKERQAEREKLLEKVQRMKREKAAMERAAERAQQAVAEPAGPHAAEKIAPSGKHDLSPSDKEGEPRPKKLSVRSVFSAVNLEDTTGVVLPTAQPGPKNAIKFHLKSLVKPKTDRIEVVDLSGDEEEENEGDQIVKARNMLKTAQERLGKK